MAGLWDRLLPGDDRVNVHLLKAAVDLRVRGTFTAGQILTALNAQLTTPLNAAAQTDLTNIVTQASVGNATAKLDYLNKLDALAVAVECGAFKNEATWRSQLGIV